MAAPERQVRAAGRPRLAWFGLLMMLASFLWLENFSESFSFGLTSGRAANDRGDLSLVIIDPGHGGQDSGAMRDGVLEKDLSLDVGRRLARRVEAAGLTSLLTRADDNYISLSGRAELANRQSNAIFVSIHFDEATRPAATGIETYYAAHQIKPEAATFSWLPFLQNASLEAAPSPRSESLAAFIQEALVARTKAVNRGTRAEQFFVIARVRHPAVLVEGGFLTNKNDVSKMTSDAYREELAAAICAGIVRYREVVRPRPLASPSA